MSHLLRLALLLAACLPGLARAAAVPLAAALDGSGLVWTTGGSTAWSGQTTISHDGADAAQTTGLAALEAESWLETTVTAPGILSWHWRLDLGPDNGSALEFFVGDDPDARQALLQTTPWTAATEAIEGSGPVKIRWRLLNDTDAPAALSDAAFLDQVAFVPFGPSVLQTPTGLTARGFTARWSAVPDATAYVVEVASSAAFADVRATDSVAPPATSVLVTNLEPLTTYHYRLVATGPDNLAATSTPLTVTTPAIKRPANDAFANATTLSGVSGSVAASNLDATLETTEPESHLASVWFSWTAPTAGRWRFTTTAEGFDTTLLLYTGNTLANLVAVAEDDDGGEAGASVLDFDADAGVTYRLALDSLSGGQGATTLVWQRLELHTPPANDAFANAATLSGNSGSLDATNLHATAESAEPAPAARSVWWRWTAPAAGFWSVESTGSEIPVTLRLWSGSSLAGLTLLGSDSGPSSRAGIPVAAGLTYRVSLDGQLGAQGALRLAWAFTIPTVAQTIAFAPLPDLGVNAEPFALAASASSGLPVAFTLVSGPATLAEDGVTLALTGSTGTVTILASQTGDATRLPAPPVTRTFAVRPPPANDALANATSFAGPSGSLTGTNLFATAEPGDPYPASHSVWWRWTAPAAGILTLDTAGSAIPAALSVLSGPALDDLEVLAADARSGVTARLSLPVTAGTTYQVALDALDDRQGALRLAWSLTPPAREQTITFDPLPDVGVDAAPLQLIASTDSGLPVVFTLVSGPANLVDDVLELTGRPGAVTLRATQPGDALHKPAAAVTRSFTVRTPPGNDEPADASRLSGANGSANGSNLYATAGLSDPYPSSHSVWWRWTAPDAGIWTVDTAGSAIPAALSVLSGPADDLEFLASDARPGASGRVAVPVVAGVTYYLALDAFSDLQGALRLEWTLTPPARPQTITFDQALPDLVVGEPGFALFASSDSGLPVILTLVSGPAMLENDFLEFTGRPGTITLRATQPGDAYYQAAPPITRSFTVTKLPPIKITFADLRQTYTGFDLAVTATATPAPRFTDLAITYNGESSLPRDAGTYTVVATADDSRATAKLVVTPASLNVTALDQRKLAGQANPDFTLAYAGFRGVDGEYSLTRSPIATSTARQNSPGGIYPIKPSGGLATNYTFTYVPGTLQVDSFAGRYEALLVDPATQLPAAKLEFTIAASGDVFTGLLTLPSAPAPLALKGTLSLDDEEDTATIDLNLPNTSPALRLTLALPLLGEFSATLSTGETTLGTATDGVRIFTPGPKEKLRWAGAHTLILSDPAPADSTTGSALPAPGSFPLGAGHATATIDAKGNLKLAGKLGDGQALTATLAPGPSGDYRLFAQPYPKRAASYLGGALPLASHPSLPERRHLPASAGVRLAWAKAPSPTKPLDASYRSGFGPLAVSAVIEPWLPPSAATPLNIRLSLGSAPASFALDYSVPEGTPLSSAQLASLPTTLPLAANGKAVLPAASANPAKFALTFSPATGAFSGSFILSDQITPAPAKPTLRTVKFTGILLQPPAPPATGAPTTIGAGFFLVPDLVKTAEQPSGEIRLAIPGD